MFQEGDIVELQISFIVVPLRDQNSRINVVLRSIGLLEGKYTQVREKQARCIYVVLTKSSQDAFVKAASAKNTSKATTKITLKRKVGYIDEEISVTRTKLALMEIEEGKRDERADSGPSTVSE
jgi:hypothetical protein